MAPGPAGEAPAARRPGAPALIAAHRLPAGGRPSSSGTGAAPDRAARDGRARVGVLGTRYTMDGPLYRRELAARGCDAVALVCTEIPLLVTPDVSPLPTLDSTRLLARAAFAVAAGREPFPRWRGGPVASS